MRIAVGRLVLDFYNNTNVSLKRRNIADLCQDMRKQFNLSALEIADFDDPERCVIGFSAVLIDSIPSTAADHFVENIARAFDSHSFARVTVEDLDILHFD